jgi:hypothetical protein
LNCAVKFRLFLPIALVSFTPIILYYGVFQFFHRTTVLFPLYDEVNGKGLAAGATSDTIQSKKSRSMLVSLRVMPR